MPPTHGAIRHVPGFDPGSRGDKDKRHWIPDYNVGNDRKRKGKTLDPRSSLSLTRSRIGDCMYSVIPFDYASFDSAQDRQDRR